MQLSVVIITFNEEANIGRTLESVKALVSDGKGEIIVVDSGSTDRTVEIAKSYGAKVFVKEWKGFAAQKNSAIDKATGDWILSLDADEEVSDVAQAFVLDFLFGSFGVELRNGTAGILLGRRNYFLGRWIRFGGFYPDKKLRLIRRGVGNFQEQLVHEDIQLSPHAKLFDPSLHRSFQGSSRIDLIHHSYPTVSDYIEHMNRYSSLGAEMVVAKGKPRFHFLNIAVRPVLTFIYNYFLRLGFFDGKEGLLLHLNHAIYVSWKYAKAYELSQQRPERKKRMSS